MANTEPYSIEIEHGANGLCRANLHYFNAWNELFSCVSMWHDCQESAIAEARDQFIENVNELLESEFADSFMKPYIYKGELIEWELMQAGLDAEPDSFYCRLSAPGYMDCTEWDGPYETEWDAVNALIQNYGKGV